MNKEKEKNKKNKISNKNTETLDYLHLEMINEITKEEQSLPDLYIEKENLIKNLKSTNLNLESKLLLKDNIQKINRKINYIKNKTKEYYLDNSKYIFNYFEEKKNINNECNNVKIVDNFFNLSNNIKENPNTNTNIQKYLKNINKDYIDINDFIVETNICRGCNQGELISIEHDGILVCNNCSRHYTYLIENEKPSYKEPPKEVSFYAYKRINHFREILAQFQAKETTDIPEEILEKIKNQIKKERININDLDNVTTKEILKKLGYNKYYEHIPFIKDKLGIKPPIMSPELEEILCNLFLDIQTPYSKHMPKDRVNFLNYYYTVYKLCELLDEKEFLPYFPMLKDPEKRIEQDDIWKKICVELNWRFIPTL